MVITPVEVTDSNGCFSISNAQFISTTGINVLPLAGNIDILPNPATGQFNIHCTGNFDKDIRMSLFNVMGQKMIDNNYHISNGQTIPVSVDKLAAGIYMVQIQSGSQSFTRKLIIE